MHNYAVAHHMLTYVYLAVFVDSGFMVLDNILYLLTWKMWQMKKAMSFLLETSCLLGHLPHCFQVQLEDPLGLEGTC